MANGHLGAEKCSGTNYCTTGCNLVLRENLLIFLQGLSPDRFQTNLMRATVVIKSEKKLLHCRISHFFVIYVSEMGQAPRRLPTRICFCTIFQFFRALWLGSSSILDSGRFSQHIIWLCLVEQDHQTTLKLSLNNVLKNYSLACHSQCTGLLNITVSATALI